MISSLFLWILFCPLSPLTFLNFPATISRKHKTNRPLKKFCANTTKQNQNSRERTKDSKVTETFIKL
jgi:hypothetical protein